MITAVKVMSTHRRQPGDCQRGGSSFLYKRGPFNKNVSDPVVTQRTVGGAPFADDEVIGFNP